jgi:hypothetical protein
VLIDDTHQGLLYNPVNDVILPLPQLASSTDNCLWDSADTGALLFGAKLFASCSWTKTVIIRVYVSMYGDL